jgi:hypothetical protein
MEAKKHFCAGPSCPGFFHKASDIAHPPSCARAPQHLPAVARERCIARARFAEARHQLRLATSSLDAVLDDGESVWSAEELFRRVLDATAALAVITDVAEHVTAKLLGTTETLDEALDAIGAELKGQL